MFNLANNETSPTRDILVAGLSLASGIKLTELTNENMYEILKSVIPEWMHVNMQRRRYSIGKMDFTDVDGIKYDGNRTSFVVGDLASMIHGDKLPITHIHEITMISVPKELRRRGYATTALHVLINKYPDDLFIVCAGALDSEYPEEPSEEEYDELFKNLTAFYESMPFIDINFYIDYDTQIPFLYVGNNSGVVAIRELIKILEKEKRK
jgi:hypothetical protein